MIAKTQKIEETLILEAIQELLTTKSKLTNIEIVGLLKKMVPEFISNNSIFEKLDHNEGSLN